MNKIALRRIFVLALLCTLKLSAQTSTGDLRGYVRDPQGATIANATVTVEDTTKGFSRTVTTDAAGFYQVLLLPPDGYTVTASAPGFGKLVNKGVIITIGQSADLPLTLQVAGATAEVTVNANADVIETERSAQGTTIDQERIVNLPINGRNYINFTLTNSQVARDAAPSIGAIPTSGLNFGGARARSNAINIDGADNTDYIGNGNRSTLSQEAVQEFQLLTNSFPVEYGRASGGIVNIVSKSGNNDFHGSAFGFLRNRNIQAVNPFSTVKNPEYTRVQAGFSLGGPIIKDRTFYFFATEITRRQETGFTSIGTNTNAFGLVQIDASKFFGFPAGSIPIQGTPQQKAFLDAVPTQFAPLFQKYVAGVASSSSLAVTGANPAFLVPTFGPTGFATSGAPTPASFVALQSLAGNFPVTEKTEVYSLRLDHKLTQSQQLFVRGNVSPSFITGIEENAANQNFGENAASRTATQRFHDFSVVGQHTWILTPFQVNELRIQFSRHPINFSNTNGPGGSAVAVNIPGFAYFGKTPYSVIDRIEKQIQLQDNYTIVHGQHSFKFGVDGRYIPIRFNQGGLYSGGDYSFGSISAASLDPAAAGLGLPDFSPIQAYGLGIPQSFVQAIGRTTQTLNIKTFGTYAQDQWKISRKLTANYGLRYDVTGYPVHTSPIANTAAAFKALGIGEGFPTRLNSFAPRLGLAYDPGGNGHTVIRAAYGLYYDRIPGSLELQATKFNTNDIPIIILAGGTPCTPLSTPSPLNLNATNTFQGTLSNSHCVPGSDMSLGYLSNEQRFFADNNNSLFTNQNYLKAGFPLAILPSGLPSDNHYYTPYAIQANVGVERDLGHNMSLNVAYLFNGGRHLNRPINANPVNPQFLLNNFERAIAAGAANPTDNPLTVGSTMPCGVGPAGPFVAPALVNFFRRGGLNQSLANAFQGTRAEPCVALAQQIILADGLGVGVPVNFSDVTPNRTNGTSNYNALSVNLRKRFSTHYEYLASYTWSHAIDDSTDVVSVSEGPQSEFAANAERATSSFDQRHRFVLSGVYNSAKLGGDGFASKVFSDVTVAPIIEISSGRPFNILTGVDTNFNFTPLTDRPSVVPASTTPDNCGHLPVASKYSRTGFLNLPCYIDSNPTDGVFNGNVNGTLGRNAGTRPYVVFTDLRIGKTLNFSDRYHLELMADAFNLINKFNVLDVNLLYTQAGKPTAAYDPRQFQFGARFSF